MANEKRLIDANGIISNLQEVLDRNYDKRDLHTYRALDVVLNKLKNIPTVDAVEVVRCKDCKHWNEQDNIFSGCRCVYWKGIWDYTKADDFCSYGERREGE